MKPLGYYTSYVPGTGGVLEDLQTKYGCHLQRLNTRERLFLAKKLILQINKELACDGDLIDELNDLANNQIRPLSVGDKLGIIRCLVNEVENDN
ncbi:hypothetical protein IQ227_07300 [Anabaena aphanizomenioides LEGE 00250]|uniref:Uncharacterized protein n=1 Tax=Sphaerospermopsis aphanizomenoides LEGE 00250 TaxID=2777972 RepID=A0ABR9VDQ4_9CYAN|nr:hypothetical protein [Sphaerospermopsis aphanizomenoides]MBE9235847.1 hypothetical protein [Sphaerospermopsis aphanizomenoides LEGE 00250]